jgi:hypothetical protein
MASALRKMTGIGADVRQIAALLQAKAPKGHMLAYITPQEAALLKAEGGSGKPHEDTGIPSFEVGATGGESYGDYYDNTSAPAESYSGPSGAEESATVGLPPQVSETISAAPPPEISTFPMGSQFETPTAPVAPGLAGATPADLQQYMDIGAGRATALPDQEGPQKGYADKLSEALGISKGDLGKLGVAGIQGLLGGKQATQAREAGQAGKQEIQAVAAPYQAKGQELQAAAQRGELTPTGQQAIAAARAQAAQGAQARGGVGAQQTEAQVQALRNQLLQQQYDYGLKLSGIGDQMALGAIRTGMQADQYANQLTSSYFNNIARIAAGTPTATPGAT